MPTPDPGLARPSTHAERPLAVKITVVAGPDQGREAALQPRTLVGRDPTCGLVLSDPQVARQHLSLSPIEGAVVVEDLGSEAGTFLGGRRLFSGEGHTIPLGSVLKAGATSLAIRPRRSLREVAPSSGRRFGELVGVSLAMRELFAWVEKIAFTDLLLLIEGEAGTGKKLLARSIHQASAAAAGPFVLFDCRDPLRSPEELEAALLQAFRRASGGTLCLGEVAELSLPVQGRMLSLLEDREVSARLIALTEHDLHAEVVRGRFRSDIHLRLIAGTRLRIPPLRSRPEDIPALTDYLLAGRLAPGSRVGGDNLALLMGWNWPGNVGELKQALVQAVELATREGEKPQFSALVLQVGSEQPATLGPVFPGVTGPKPFKDCKEELLSAFERAYVGALLLRHHGNVTRAAAQAGLSRKHLYDLIRKTRGLTPETPLAARGLPGLGNRT